MPKYESTKNTDSARVGGQAEMNQGYPGSMRYRAPEAGNASAGRKIRAAGTRARGLADINKAGRVRSP